MKKYTLFLALLATINFAKAQPGTLDNSFGMDGKVLDTSIWAYCRVVSIQPDGKILTGGNTPSGSKVGGLYIARYNSDGTIDYNFGIEGKVIIRSIEGASPLYTQSIVVLPDNKILACGRFIVNSPYGGIGLLRLLPDGKIDSSFGKAGFVVTKLSNWNDIIAGMAVTDEGKIIVGGNKQTGFSQPGPDFIIRYLANGTIDNSFGAEGIVYKFYNSNVIPGALKLQIDGKIITGGIYGSLNKLFQIVRFNSDGTVDQEFGTGGIAQLAAKEGHFNTLNDLAIQSDGKIVAVGLLGTGSMAVARFNSNGTTDLGFGDFEGYSYSLTIGTIAEAKSVFINQENKIILTGSYFNDSTSIAALCYNTNGSVDSLFGESGIATGGFPEKKYGADFTSGKGVLQSDGKIIISGSFLQDDEDTFNTGIFRYNGTNDKRSKYVRIKHILHRHGITWEDKPDNDLQYYSIQRSNGSSFIEIARVNKQSSGLYQFEDATANDNSSYKIAAVSKNSKMLYSNIVTIESGISIKLYPNSAHDILQIQGLPANTKARLIITDLSGNVLLTAITNTTSYVWNISRLQKGGYILRVETNGILTSKSFIKE